MDSFIFSSFLLNYSNCKCNPITLKSCLNFSIPFSIFSKFKPQDVNLIGGSFNSFKKQISYQSNNEIANNPLYERKTSCDSQNSEQQDQCYRNYSNQSFGPAYFRRQLSFCKQIHSLSTLNAKVFKILIHKTQENN